MWCVSYRSTLSFTALGRSSSSMIWLTPWSTITWPTDRTAHQRDSTLMCWSREFMHIHKQHYPDLQTHSTYCSAGTLVMQLRLHLKNTQHTALRDSVCVYLFITIYVRLGCVCRLLSLPPLLFPFFIILRPLFHFGDSLRWELCYLPHAWMHIFITQVFKKTYNPLCGFPCPTTHIDWWKWCWQCSQTSFDSHVWSTCCWTFKSLLDGAKDG